MQNFINLQQTPFIDLRDKKKNSTIVTLESKLPSENLPTNQDQIEYKIHQNFTKYDEKPYLIADQEDQKIITEIIKAARQEFRIGLDILTSKKFKQLSLKHVNTVVKYLKQDNPQAAFIALRAKAYDNRYSISVEKLKQIAKKTGYPLLLSQVQSFLFISSKEKQVQIAKGYLDKIVKHGLPEGFLWKGLIETKFGDGKKAYEMFKNAQKLGLQPSAYKYLGQLFMGQNLLMTANLRLADKYFKKAKQTGAYLEPYILQQMKQLEYEKQRQKMKTNSIKSTQDTQSVVLANFLNNKINQFKNSSLLKNLYSFGTTQNMVNSQSVTFFNEPKTFYVVFSPLMLFPGRHFLAKDIKGQLQYISFYNWDQIPIQKLKLIHEVGTKVVLNDYIRKVGANDQLPIYRVEKPQFVQIHKRTEKHTISDKQFRNFAKNLFQRNLLDKAMTIYQYMIMKGSQQMQIIYSNMGVIYERQKNIPQAIDCYLKSLKIKKFNKSQMRLAYIYLRNKEFSKVQDLIKQIQSQTQRQQLLKEIQKLKEKENDFSNFSKNTKNKKKVKKQLSNDRISQSNPSVMSNIRQDRWNLLYQKQKIEEALNFKGLAQETFLDLIQLVYNSVENKELNKQTVKRFFKMTEVCYRQKFQNNLYPFSSPYLAVVMSEVMQMRKSMFPNASAQTILYMAMRQNYLQNRIEDLCIEYEQKGQYKKAEQIYRYTQNYCVPFNVKVAEMLFMQGKFEQCAKYCTEIVRYLNQYICQRFFKYIAELSNWQLKSLIRLGKLKQVIQKGEKYIRNFSKKNPKLLYEDYTYKKKGFISFKETASLNSIQLQEVKQMASGDHMIRKINQQITRALILMKKTQKAKQYLPKILLKKQNCKDQDLVESYYQSKMIQILVAKMSNPVQVIKQISLIQKQIDCDKLLENKQPYTKFLLKQKLSLLIETQNIVEAIKQSQEIVKINSVNFIFVKSKLLSLVKRNPKKIIQLLDKIKSSDTLNCLWAQLFQRSKTFLQKNLNLTQGQKQTENVLLLLQKLDIENQPEDQQDNKFQQQSDLSSDASSFYNGNEDEKVSDFHDQLYHDQYENQICRFQAKNHVTYIVIFEESLKNTLQAAEYRRFVCAADHLCRREYGSTGIKISGTEIRLKIRKSARLTGKIIENPADPKIKFCFFNKKQRHDDYKRQNNK